MQNRRRARSDSQKFQRRQAIIDTAWDLYRTTGYDALTIAQVAEQVGVAKGTIYLYFATKEALFLAVQEQRLVVWFDTLDTTLRNAPRPSSARMVAALISESVVAQPEFTRLLAILHPIIEQNIEYAQAKAFKLFLRDRLGTSGQLIAQQLPPLTAERGAQVLLWAYALVIGMTHLSTPAPALVALVREPGLAALQVDFAPAFAAALEAMLVGLTAGTVDE